MIDVLPSLWQELPENSITSVHATNSTQGPKHFTTNFVALNIIYKSERGILPAVSYQMFILTYFNPIMKLVASVSSPLIPGQKVLNEVLN